MSARDLVEREVSFFGGEIITLVCKEHRRFAATRSSPGEGGLEVVDAIWRGISIFHVLSESEISELEDKCE